MKLRTTLFVGLVVSLAAAMPAMAQSSDFIIDVPVILDELPSQAVPVVWCFASIPGTEQLSGFGSASVPTNSQTSFTGQVRVQFDRFPPDDVDPAPILLHEVTDYRCILLMTTNWDDSSAGIVRSWDTCIAEGLDVLNEPLRCGARNAFIVGEVSGTFSQ